METTTNARMNVCVMTCPLFRTLDFGVSAQSRFKGARPHKINGQHGSQSRPLFLCFPRCYRRAPMNVCRLRLRVFLHSLPARTAGFPPP